MAAKGLTDGQHRTEEGVQRLRLYDLRAEITIITGPPGTTKVEVEGSQKILTMFSRARGVFDVFSELEDLSSVSIRHIVASGAGSVAAGGDINGGQGSVATSPSQPTTALAKKSRITVTVPPEVEVIAEVTTVIGKITFERQR